MEQEKKDNKEKNQYVRRLTEEKYKYGFTTDVDTEIIEKGLSEEVVRLISEKKGEPSFIEHLSFNAFNEGVRLKECFNHHILSH